MIRFRVHVARGKHMKLLVLLFAVATLALTGVAGAHGGGCRKSSPPGQCCHMDNSEGRVHCH